MTRAEELLALAERVATAKGLDNATDVEVEVALFEPDSDWVSIRANDAGTKTICTATDGSERTFWARDFTISAGNRREAATALRAKARALAAIETGAAA